MFQSLVQQEQDQDMAQNKHLKSYFKNSDANLVKLLFDLLEFNPHNRVSAAEALKNPVFNKIRNPNLEKPAKTMIQLEFDQAGCYDYETGTDLFFKHENQFRQFVLKERQLIQQYHQKQWPRGVFLGELKCAMNNL